MKMIMGYRATMTGHRQCVWSIWSPPRAHAREQVATSLSFRLWASDIEYGKKGHWYSSLIDRSQIATPVQWNYQLSAHAIDQLCLLAFMPNQANLANFLLCLCAPEYKWIWVPGGCSGSAPSALWVDSSAPFFLPNYRLRSLRSWLHLGAGARFCCTSVKMVHKVPTTTHRCRSELFKESITYESMKRS